MQRSWRKAAALTSLRQEMPRWRSRLQARSLKKIGLEKNRRLTEEAINSYEQYVMTGRYAQALFNLAEEENALYPIYVALQEIGLSQEKRSLKFYS